MFILPSQFSKINSDKTCVYTFNYGCGDLKQLANSSNLYLCIKVDIYLCYRIGSGYLISTI